MPFILDQLKDLRTAEEWSQQLQKLSIDEIIALLRSITSETNIAIFWRSLPSAYTLFAQVTNTVFDSVRNITSVKIGPWWSSSPNTSNIIPLELLAITVCNLTNDDVESRQKLFTLISNKFFSHLSPENVFDFLKQDDCFLLKKSKEGKYIFAELIFGIITKSLMEKRNYKEWNPVLEFLLEKTPDIYLEDFDNTILYNPSVNRVIGCLSLALLGKRDKNVFSIFSKICQSTLLAQQKINFIPNFNLSKEKSTSQKAYCCYIYFSFFANPLSFMAQSNKENYLDPKFAHFLVEFERHYYGLLEYSPLFFQQDYLETFKQLNDFQNKNPETCYLSSQDKKSIFPCLSLREVVRERVFLQIILSTPQENKKTKQFVLCYNNAKTVTEKLNFIYPSLNVEDKVSLLHSISQYYKKPMYGRPRNEAVETNLKSINFLWILVRLCGELDLAKINQEQRKDLLPFLIELRHENEGFRYLLMYYQSHNKNSCKTNLAAYLLNQASNSLHLIGKTSSARSVSFFQKEKSNNTSNNISLDLTPEIDTLGSFFTKINQYRPCWGNGFNMFRKESSSPGWISRLYQYAMGSKSSTP